MPGSSSCPTETHSTIELLARSADLHPEKVVRKAIRLAFLNPAFTKPILDGERMALTLLRDLESIDAFSWLLQGAL